MPVIPVIPGGEFSLRSVSMKIPYVWPQEERADVMRRILFVGGVKNHSDNLGINDTLYLLEVLRLCADHNVAVSPQANIYVSNLSYGHDFLKDPTPADIVVFAFLFHSRLKLHEILANEEGLLDPVLQSDRAYKRGAWTRALQKTGARFAFNITGPDCNCELPTRKLLGNQFNVTAQHQFGIRDKPLVMNMITRRQPR